MNQCSTFHVIVYPLEVFLAHFILLTIMQATILNRWVIENGRWLADYLELCGRPSKDLLLYISGADLENKWRGIYVRVYHSKIGSKN